MGLVPKLFFLSQCSTVFLNYFVLKNCKKHTFLLNLKQIILKPIYQEMKQLNVYLSFPDGKCRDALHFYEKALGGEISSLKTFGSANQSPKPELDDYVMHAEFKADDIFLMACDAMPHHKSTPGTNVTLSINLDDKKEQTRIFDALAEGGVVQMALQKTFWGARFGMLTDKYGISWMTNCNGEK